MFQVSQSPGHFVLQHWAIVRTASGRRSAPSSGLGLLGTTRSLDAPETRAGTGGVSGGDKAGGVAWDKKIPA